MARKNTHTTEPPHLVGKLPAGSRHQPRAEMLDQVARLSAGTRYPGEMEVQVAGKIVRYSPALKESEWLDIGYLREMSPPKGVVGIEILVRFALHEEDEQVWVADILDHAREFGAAEITKRVPLIGGK